MREGMKKYSEITVTVAIDEPQTSKELSDLSMKLAQAAMSSSVNVTNLRMDFKEDEKANDRVVERVIETDSNKYIAVSALINFSAPRTGLELRHIGMGIAELIAEQDERVDSIWFDHTPEDATQKRRTLTIYARFGEPRTAEETGHFLTETLSEAAITFIPDKTTESYHYVEAKTNGGV